MTRPYVHGFRTHLARLAAPLMLGVAMAMAAVGDAAAMDAWITFRNSPRPVYVTNLRVHYRNDFVGQERFVMMLGEQRKYVSFDFRQVRAVRFQGVASQRAGMVSYVIRLDLKDGGSHLAGMLMPIRALSGSASGRPWKFETGSYDEELAREMSEPLQEIRFAPGIR